MPRKSGTALFCLVLAILIASSVQATLVDPHNQLIRIQIIPGSCLVHLCLLASPAIICWVSNENKIYRGTPLIEICGTYNKDLGNLIP